jgi:hypothetical protein
MLNFILNIKTKSVHNQVIGLNGLLVGIDRQQCFQKQKKRDSWEGSFAKKKERP